MDNGILNSKRRRDNVSSSVECLLAYADELAHVLVFGDGEKGGFAGEKIAGNEAFAEEYRKAADAVGFENAFSEAPAESAGFLKKAGKSFGAVFGTWLCKRVCEKMKAGGRPVPYTDFIEEKAPEDLRIAYVRNPYSDEMYDFFSKIIPGASVTYPGSFAGVCEEVYDGQAGFCLLPVETSSEGALPGFRQLTEKYELYQTLTAPLFTENPDGSQKLTRFALFSKSRVRIPTGDLPFKAKVTDCLKISLEDTTGERFSDVIRAAELSGLSFVRSESVPISWESGKYNCSLTLDVTGKDAAPFLLYLSLEEPESEAIGIYSDISPLV